MLTFIFLSECTTLLLPSQSTELTATAAMLLLSVLSFLLPAARAEQCRHPAPAPHYNNTQYAGGWYEVAQDIVFIYFKRAFQIRRLSIKQFIESQIHV